MILADKIIEFTVGCLHLSSLGIKDRLCGELTVALLHQLCQLVVNNLLTYAALLQVSCYVHTKRIVWWHL